MGYKGTGKRLCSGCKTKGIATILTADNCPPSVFKKGMGNCRACAREQASRKTPNPEAMKKASDKYRFSHLEIVRERTRKGHRTVSGRHTRLKFRIKNDNVPITDLIFSLSFYAELIRDNECHYCLGPLNVTGLGLDRIDNSLGHFCFNVVPCCKSCNQKKSCDTTYDEMTLLAPALREIRRRREMNNVAATVPDL